MQQIEKTLSCNVLRYINNSNTQILSVSVRAIDKIKPVIDYFSKYTFLGTKNMDFYIWVQVYDNIVNKQHLTKVGKSIIRLIKSNMNSKRIHEQLIIKPGLIYKINFKNMFVGLATIFVSFFIY